MPNRGARFVGLIAALVLLAAASLARAAPVTTPATGPVRDQGTGIVLPMSLGGMQLVSVTDFQSPGLGVSYRYREANDPFNFDLYIYNKGQTIPTGSDSAIVRQEIEIALNDIRTVASQGVYRNVEFGSVQDCPFGTVVFRCVSIKLESNGRVMTSLLMLRGERGYFLKIRASWLRDDLQAPVTVQRWGSAFGELLQR